MEKRDPILLVFGRNVRALREKRNLTQEALAEKADLDRTYISDIERGARNPSVKILSRLAKGLASTCSELCRGIEK